jgi:hypothetical protein
MANSVKLLMGSKSVTVSGIPEPLASAGTPNIEVDRLIICAKRKTTGNTGSVFLGDSTLTVTKSEGIELVASTIWEVPLRDDESMLLSDMFIDADTSGDGITYMYALVKP